MNIRHDSGGGCGLISGGQQFWSWIQAVDGGDCKFPSNWKSSPVEIINVGKVGSPRECWLHMCSLLGLCWAWAHVGFVGPMVRTLGPCWVYPGPILGQPVSISSIIPAWTPNRRIQNCGHEAGDQGSRGSGKPSQPQVANRLKKSRSWETSGEQV